MIYLFILIVLIACSIKNDFLEITDTKQSKTYKLICLAFILLAGLRFYVGSDTHNYVYDFSIMPKLSDLVSYHNMDSRYQIGWDALVCIIKEIFGNFVFVQLVTSLIINAIIFWFISKSTSNVFLALVAYFVLNYFEYNMEIMREAIAISIGLVAIFLYNNGKKKYSLLLFIIAFEFHISAIILLIVPLLNSVKYSRRTIVVTLIASIIVPLVFSQITGLVNIVNLFAASNPEYLLHYLNQSFDESRNILYYLELYVQYLFLPMFCVNLLKDQTKHLGMILAFVVIRCLSMYTYAFYRFGNYFEPFYWILIADTVFVLWRNSKMSKRTVVILCTLSLLFVYQRTQLKEYSKYPGVKLYERYIPYEMVNSTDRNYGNNTQSQYYFRNGRHDF